MNTTEQRRKLFISIGLRRCSPGSGSSLQFLKQTTWKKPVTDLKALIKKTPFVIVGGIATRLYMPERMTDDLDILVLTNDQEIIDQELQQCGSKKIGQLTIGGSSWLLPDGTLLDVIALDRPWVKEAISNYSEEPNQRLPIISLPYLILMKLEASRSQDLADVTRMLGVADNANLSLIQQTVKTYLPNALEDLESLIMLGKLELSPHQ